MLKKKYVIAGLIIGLVLLGNQIYYDLAQTQANSETADSWCDLDDDRDIDIDDIRHFCDNYITYWTTGKLDPTKNVTVTNFPQTCHACMHACMNMVSQSLNLSLASDTPFISLQEEVYIINVEGYRHFTIALISAPYPVDITIQFIVGGVTINYQERKTTDSLFQFCAYVPKMRIFVKNWEAFTTYVWLGLFAVSY